MIQNLHSDDFGYRPFVDEKLIALIRKKKLTGVSVLATNVSKKSLKALSESRNEYSNLTISLHLNLIEGKSISNPDDISTLVDARGNFYPSAILFIRLILRMVKLEHIRRETEAQLSYLKRSGLAVSMIDSHQHTHALSPVAEIVCKVGKEHGINTIRPFNAVSNHTIKARLTYLALCLMSIATHLIYNGRLALPATWHMKSKDTWTIMSWEGSSYDSSKNVSSGAFHIVHPYLNFDSNTSYASYISLPRK